MKILNSSTKKIGTKTMLILLIVLAPLFAVMASAFADVSTSVNNTNLANVIVDIKPFQPPNILLAFGISVLIVAVTTKVTSHIVQRARLRSQTDEERTNDKLYHGSFWDIIREGDYNPSLARFQFLLWTMVVSFAVISIFFIRSLGGVPSYPNGDLIPPNLLQVIGISTATPVISNVASRLQYASTFPNGMPLKDKVPKFSTMLLEGNKPTLARYQMFLWTWISVIFFLFVFFSSISDITKQIETANNDPLVKSSPLRTLSVQDIDAKLVILMGLSQGGYVAAKFVARQPIRVTSFVLNHGNLVSIFGDNFGDTKGIVKMDDLIITPTDITWSDTRIDLNTPLSFAKKQIIVVITSDGQSQSQRWDEDLIQ